MSLVVTVRWVRWLNVNPRLAQRTPRDRGHVEAMFVGQNPDQPHQGSHAPFAHHDTFAIEIHRTLDVAVCAYVHHAVPECPTGKYGDPDVVVITVTTAVQMRRQRHLCYVITVPLADACEDLGRGR